MRLKYSSLSENGFSELNIELFSLLIRQTSGKNKDKQV